MMFTFRHALLASAATFVATAACAQVASTAPESPPKGAQPVAVVQEVIVTAQKRSENLQEVPISVTAISNTQLESQHVYDPSQLGRVAPTLQMESFNASVGGTNFSVRGVGTLSFASSIEASVTTVIDGVVMGRPEFGIMNFSDIAQVEVLNGPQGMLFGKNASAGLVNITTVLPVLGLWQGSGHAEYGWMSTPGNGKGTADNVTLNAPVSANSALRINAFFTQHDPLVRDVLTVPGSDFGQQEFGFRAKYYWQPSDRLNVLVAADYAQEQGEGPGATADRSVAAGSPFLGLDQAVGIVPGPQNARLSSDAPTNNHFNVGGIQLNANYDMGGGYKVTEVAAYRKFQNQQIFDVDDHQINIANTNQGGQSDYQISNEIRLSSPDEKKLQYQIGLYYYYGRITGHNDIRANLGSSPPPGYTAVLGTFASSEENTSSYAVFGQATYRFTDQARLVVGARETYDDLDIHSFSSQGTNLIPLGLPGTVSSKQSINNTNFSFRVTGQFDFTRDIMGYASVARGYKGPGFNGAAFIINTPPIAPEIPTAFEIGLKTRLFEDRLTLNVSAFDETFKGFQAQGYNIATQSYLVTNAGQLNSRGFDATFTAVPVSDLTINGGVSFVDAFFHSYAKDQCYGGDPRCVGGIHDSTGNRLPNAPRWSGSVSADYRHDINERLRAFANIALSGRSLVNYSSNGDPHTIQPGYSLFDGSLGVGPRDGTWRVSAFCRNCFDQRFVTYIEANPVSPTDYGQQFGIDSFRTVGMSLDVKL